MLEQYVVAINGKVSASDECVGRRRALELALSTMQSADGEEVVVAEARTLSVCALWRRRGATWAVQAVAGWLS